MNQRKKNVDTGYSIYYYLHYCNKLTLPGFESNVSAPMCWLTYPGLGKYGGAKVLSLIDIGFF